MGRVIAPDVRTLIAAAVAVGLRFRATNEELRIRGPKGAEGLARLLLSHKAEVLAVLNGEKDQPSAHGDDFSSERKGRHSHFTWDELSRWRWGSAVGDPTPGIIINQPDPARRLAALQHLLDHPDEEALQERLAIQADGSE